MISQNNLVQNSRVYEIAIYSSLAAVIHLLENYISLPVPFFRIGLSNVIIMFFVFRKRYLSALLISLNKTLLGSFFAGKLFSFAFVLSLGGSLTSTALMILLFSFTFYPVSKNMISIYGAMTNNLTQYLLFIFLIDRNVGFAFSSFSSVIILFSLFSGFICSFLVFKLLKYFPANC